MLWGMTRYCLFLLLCYFALLSATVVVLFVSGFSVLLSPGVGCRTLVPRGGCSPLGLAVWMFFGSGGDRGGADHGASPPPSPRMWMPCPRGYGVPQVA